MPSLCLFCFKRIIVVLVLGTKKKQKSTAMYYTTSNRCNKVLVVLSNSVPKKQILKFALCLFLSRTQKLQTVSGYPASIYPSLGLLLITACTCRQFQAYFIPNWLLIPPLCMSPSRAQAGSDCRKGHDETSYVGVWADLGCRDRAAQRGALVWWQVILKTSWKQEPEGLSLIF